MGYSRTDLSGVPQEANLGLGRFYVASEEAAIHEVCTPDSVRYARGGEPMMGELKCAEVQECKS